MSREGQGSAIDLTRRMFAAANAGDYDTILSFFAPESVWDVSDWGLGSHTGLVAIRHSLEGWMGSFDEYAVVVEDLVDLGGGVVLAVATQHAHAERGGHVRLRYAPVFVWDGPTVVSVVHYREPGEARVAAEALAAARQRQSG